MEGECFFGTVGSQHGCYNSSAVPASWDSLIESGDQIFCLSSSHDSVHQDTTLVVYLTVGENKLVPNLFFYYKRMKVLA